MIAKGMNGIETLCWHRIQHTPEGTASLDSGSDLRRTSRHYFTWMTEATSALPCLCKLWWPELQRFCRSHGHLMRSSAVHLCLPSLCVLCCFHFLSSLLIFSAQLFHNVLFLISFSRSPPCQGEFIFVYSFRQQLQVNDVQMFILSSNYLKKLTATFHCYQHVRLHIGLRICLNFCSSTLEHISFLQKKRKKEKKSGPKFGLFHPWYLHSPWSTVEKCLSTLTSLILSFSWRGFNTIYMLPA